MSTAPTRLVGGRVVLPGEGVVETDITVADGRVTALGAGGAPGRVIDVEGRLILPGAVDPHVHLWEPDDFPSEARAAAAGGITTVLVHLLGRGDHAERHGRFVAAGTQGPVDFAFHLCVLERGQLDEMERYVRDLGVTSFKYFMTARGREAERLGIAPADTGFLYEFLERCAQLGVLPLVHCEDGEIAFMLHDRVRAAGGDGLEAWAATRPPFVEAEAIGRVRALAEAAGADAVYVPHVSSRAGIDQVRAAGGRLIAETCPHYLTLDSGHPAGVLAKINPPIKEAADREALWDAVRSGLVGSVGTDHSPRTLEHKQGGIWEASPGFPGVDTLVPLVLSEGRRRGVPIEVLAHVLSRGPAETFGLYPRKGTLLPGSDADLVVIEDDARQQITAEGIQSRAGFTPYEGMVVDHIPRLTMVRGQVVAESGRQVEAGGGAYLRRAR